MTPKQRKKLSEVMKEQYKLWLSDTTRQWLEQQKKETGKSYSQLVDECVLQSANQDFQQLVNQLTEQNKQLQKIKNEVFKTQDFVLMLVELMNYCLNENRYVGDFKEQSVEHFATKQAKQKVRDHRVKEIQAKQKASSLNQNQ